MRRPQNLKILTKQLFLLSSVKTSGRFFQIFVAFSEKRDFNNSEIHRILDYKNQTDLMQIP